MNDFSKLIEHLRSLEAIEEAGFNSDGSYNTSDDEANEFDEFEADEEAVESTDLEDRVYALREKLSQFKDTYLKEFGADNGPAPTGGQPSPEDIRQQNTIKANLNQLKTAGVDIDPTKGADDPKNAEAIGSKVQAAMADPAMANQVKSVLQKIKTQ